MATGHKGLISEMKDLTKSIMQEKCNGKQAEHEITICDITNWIVDCFDSHAGKSYVKSILLSKGYDICKKSESTHWATLTKKGCDNSELSFWLKLI